MLIHLQKDAKQIVRTTILLMIILTLVWRCVQMILMNLDNGENVDQVVFLGIMLIISITEGVEETVQLLLLFCMQILPLLDVFSRSIVQLITMEIITQELVLILAQDLYLLEILFQECVSKIVLTAIMEIQMIIYVFRCATSQLYIMLTIKQETVKLCVLLEPLELMLHHLTMFLPVNMIALFPHMPETQTVSALLTVVLGFMAIL